MVTLRQRYKICLFQINNYCLFEVTTRVMMSQLYSPTSFTVTLQHGGMITGGLIKRVLSMTSLRGTAHKKLK